MFGFGYTFNNVSPSAFGDSIDPDAQTFFTNAGITDTTQKNAVNQLVLDFKSANVWTKCKAIYPIVGGSASSHAVNLKIPGTYNLTFATGMTHSSTGMVGNGTTGFANSNLSPSAILNTNSNHLSIYSRTNIVNTGYDAGTSLLTAEAQYILIITRYTGDSGYLSANVPNSTLPNSSFTSTNSSGLFIANRTASNLINGFRNNTKILINKTVNAGTLPNANILLSAFSSYGTPSNYSNREISFASIGDGLTDTEAANFYTAVQAYQTTLNRQV